MRYPEYLSGDPSPVECASDFAKISLFSSPGLRQKIDFCAGSYQRMAGITPAHFAPTEEKTYAHDESFLDPVEEQQREVARAEYDMEEGYAKLVYDYPDIEGKELSHEEIVVRANEILSFIESFTPLHFTRFSEIMDAQHIMRFIGIHMYIALSIHYGYVEDDNFYLNSKQLIYTYGFNLFDRAKFDRKTRVFMLAFS